MQTFLMFTMRWCSDKNSRKKKKSFKLLFSKNCACQSSLVEHSEGVATWMRTERQVTHWQCVCLSKWLAAYFFPPWLNFSFFCFLKKGRFWHLLQSRWESALQKFTIVFIKSEYWCNMMMRFQYLTRATTSFMTACHRHFWMSCNNSSIHEKLSFNRSHKNTSDEQMQSGECCWGTTSLQNLGQYTKAQILPIHRLTKHIRGSF